MTEEQTIICDMISSALRYSHRDVYIATFKGVRVSHKSYLHVGNLKNGIVNHIMYHFRYRNLKREDVKNLVNKLFNEKILEVSKITNVPITEAKDLSTLSIEQREKIKDMLSSCDRELNNLAMEILNNNNHEKKKCEET